MFIMTKICSNNCQKLSSRGIEILFDGDRELTRLINKKIQDRNIQKLHWPPRDIINLI